MAVIQSAGQVNHVTARDFSEWGQILDFSGRARAYNAIYRAQPAVRKVVSYLARNMASLGLHLYRRVSDTDRERVTSHPLVRTVNRPQPWMTRFALLSLGMTDLLVSGNSVWGKVAREDDSGALWLIRFAPDRIRPHRDSPDEMELSTARGRMVIPRESLVHVALTNPDDPRWGLSPLETLRQTIAEEEASAVWRERLFQRHARPAGVIKRPPPTPGTRMESWSKTQEDRFLALWDARLTGDGPGVGGTAMLQDGMEYVPMKDQTARDSQWLEGRKWSTIEVASLYHVSPVVAGVLDNANYSNAVEFRRALYSDTLGPAIEEWEQAFASFLVTELSDSDDGLYLEFNVAAKLRASFEEQAAAMQTSIGAPWMTRNEGRARHNLPAVEGGDQLVTPLNVLVGGQASPTDSGGQNVRARGIKAEVADPLTLEWSAAHAQAIRVRMTSLTDDVRAAVVAGAPDQVDYSGHAGALHAVLYAAHVQAAQAFGTEVAGTWGSDYDVHDVGLPYLSEVARVFAEHSVETVRADAVATRGLPDDELVTAVGVLVEQAQTRGAGLAVTATTLVRGFGRVEAARAAGVPMKTWTVTSSNPRAEHVALAGETVPVDQPFSNGAMWPGDTVLPADQRVGCRCTVEFTQEVA